jgi:hypothetical protein
MSYEHLFRVYLQSYKYVYRVREAGQAERCSLQLPTQRCNSNITIVTAAADTTSEASVRGAFDAAGEVQGRSIRIALGSSLLVQQAFA